ncbi:hypothetical protein ACFPRL_13495 [Pseudoclavibacter helvolus]
MHAPCPCLNMPRRGRWQRAFFRRSGRQPRLPTTTWQQRCAPRSSTTPGSRSPSGNLRPGCG